MSNNQNPLNSNQFAGEAYQVIANVTGRSVYNETAAAAGAIATPLALLALATEIHNATNTITTALSGREN